MQFALICHDNFDALERRLAARAVHMENIHAMKADGSIIDGGAILDDTGTMCGSIVLCEFPDSAALDAYLKAEIYVREDIWKEIQIIPMKRVSWRA